MRFFKVLKLFHLILLFIGSESIAQDKVKVINKSDFSIGEVVNLNSKVLNEMRTLNIYLPESYMKDSLKKYPIIYLLDGSSGEDFIHTVGLVQFASFPWVNLLKESIVVGIANIDRKRDFTFPTDNQKEKSDYPTTGGSAKFIQYIEQEVQPFIEENYRADTISTIIGQSLGGLLATEILFIQPDLFDKYIIVSPSLWWSNSSLLQKEPKLYNSFKSIYLTVGNEGEEMEEVINNLYDILLNFNVNQRELYFKKFNELNHANILHLAIYDAFQQLSK